MRHVTFKQAVVHLSGELPQLHTKAPDFCLVDANLKEVRLKDFAGKRKLLSIVVSLDTGVCVTSSKKLDQMFQKRPDCICLEISADLPFAQKRICGAEDLHSIKTLSTICSQEFAKDYGVLIKDGPLKGLCARALIVLNEEDQVLYRELVPEITQEPNYDAALKQLFS